MNIINISESPKDWKWLEKDSHDPHLEWFNYSSLAFPYLKRIPKHDTFARILASIQGASKAKFNESVIVSHGQKLAFFASNAAKIICPEVPVLAVSFSFVGDLPQGKKRTAMVNAFKHTKKFVCYSSIEREVYANYFDIPIEHIDMLHWTAEPLNAEAYQTPIEQGRYCCALGSQGRDYQALFAAIKKLPHIRLIVVASRDSIKGLEVPTNVNIYSNITLEQSFNILANSEFMVLPLKETEIPVGHMTIVWSMLLKKTILSTDAKSVYDYIENEKTGLYFEHQNIEDLTKKIEYLWDDPSKTNALNESAHTFAQQYCSVQKAVNYLENFLKQYA